MFKHPTKAQTGVLQQVLISGLSENLCRVAPIFDAEGNEIETTTKVIKSNKVTYESQETTDQLKLHRLSAMYKQKPGHLVYQEVYASESIDGNISNYLKGATQVDNLSWLHQLCSPVMLQFSVPLTEIVSRQVQALGANSHQALLQVTQTDFLIAKHMAKKETDEHLVHYDSSKDLVEVYVQVFYGHEKWKLGVLRSPIDKIQGKFSL